MIEIAFTCLNEINANEAALDRVLQRNAELRPHTRPLLSRNSSFIAKQSILRSNYKRFPPLDKKFAYKRWQRRDAADFMPHVR